MPPRLYNPQDFLEPSTLSLNDLLGSRHYHVPAYQRDYAWRDNDQVQQLWSDLMATLDRSWNANGPVDSPRPHFFGPIVVQKRRDRLGLVDIMDGQQRLVTFSILLSVLAECAVVIQDQEDRDRWVGSLKRLLFEFSEGGRQLRVELARSAIHYEELFCTRFTDLDRQQYLESLPGTRPPELEAMVNAYSVLRNHVHSYLAGGENTDERLIRLIRTLIGLSLFLLMEVEEQGVAYEVFEGLNARGLELSQADLVKNKLFAIADHQGTLDEVRQEWEAAFVSIRGQSMVEMPDFLHLHHTVYYGAVKATELYDQVSTKTLPQTNALAYARSVKRSAERLQVTLDAGAIFSDLAIRHIERIRDILNNRYALTLILASTEEVPIDSTDYETILKLAHHFAFRRFVVERASLSTYVAEIGDAARGLAGGGSVAALAASLLEKSTDDAFTASFRAASARTAKEGFYVCEMIEHHLGIEAGMLPNSQSPSQHLEHIVPKKPAEGEWPRWTEEDLKFFLNRYGNLLVLEGTINRSIKNMGYQFKKSNPSNMDYAHSGLKLPHTLNPFEQEGEWRWTEISIDRRQRQLTTDHALAVWDLTP